MINVLLVDTFLYDQWFIEIQKRKRVGSGKKAATKETAGIQTNMTKKKHECNKMIGCKKKKKEAKITMVYASTNGQMLNAFSTSL